MARGDHQLRIRLPDDLLEQVSKAAVESNRSLNAEIVTRLQGSFSVSNTATQKGSEDIDVSIYVDQHPGTTKESWTQLASALQEALKAMSQSTRAISAIMIDPPYTANEDFQTSNFEKSQVRSTQRISKASKQKTKDK